MLRKILQAAFLLTYFTIPALSQEEKEIDRKEAAKITVPNATLKFNIPVLIIDPKHAFFVSTDTRLGNNWSLDMGVGYFFYLNDRAIYKDESFSGVRGRVGIKYYYLFGRRLAPYIGLEGMLNRFNIKEYEQVCRFGCQYWENLIVDKEVKASGISTRTGLQIFLGEKKRFMFDVYAGLGYKFVEVDENIPADAENFDRLNFFESLYDSGEGDYHVPNIILGIHFGYVFW